MNKKADRDIRLKKENISCRIEQNSWIPFGCKSEKSSVTYEWHLALVLAVVASMSDTRPNL